MALLGNISGLPLYSSIAEALSYGANYGLIGYHMHEYRGETGYMAGSSHMQAINTITSIQGGTFADETQGTEGEIPPGGSTITTY